MRSIAASMFASFSRSAVGCIAFGAACALHAQTPSAPAKPRTLAVERLTDVKSAGDLEQMIEMRRVRVLLPYSRTLYFNDKGTERGLTADLMREFEQYLNKKYAKRSASVPSRS